VLYLQIEMCKWIVVVIKIKKKARQLRFCAVNFAYQRRREWHGVVTLYFSLSALCSWIFRISKYIWCSKYGNNNHKGQVYIIIYSSFIIIILYCRLIFENLIANYLSDILSEQILNTRSNELLICNYWIYNHAIGKYHVWKYIFKYYISFNYHIWSRVSTCLKVSPFRRVISYLPYFANEV